MQVGSLEGFLCGSGRRVEWLTRRAQSGDAARLGTLTRDSKRMRSAAQRFHKYALGIKPV